MIDLCWLLHKLCIEQQLFLLLLLRHNTHHDVCLALIQYHTSFTITNCISFLLLAHRVLRLTYFFANFGPNSTTFLMPVGEYTRSSNSKRCLQQLRCSYVTTLALVAYLLHSFPVCKLRPFSCYLRSIHCLPAEAFPTRIRTTAHGISAAVGKCGAIIGAMVRRRAYTLTSTGHVYY